MAEIRAVLPQGIRPTHTARTFRAPTTSAAQIMLKGPFRLTCLERVELPGVDEYRFSIIDAEDSTVEIYGPREEMEAIFGTAEALAE